MEQKWHIRKRLPPPAGNSCHSMLLFYHFTRSAEQKWQTGGLRKGRLAATWNVPPEAPGPGSWNVPHSRGCRVPPSCFTCFPSTASLVCFPTRFPCHTVNKASWWQPLNSWCCLLQSSRCFLAKLEVWPFVWTLAHKQGRQTTSHFKCALKAIRYNILNSQYCLRYIIWLIFLAINHNISNITYQISWSRYIK